MLGAQVWKSGAIQGLVLAFYCQGPGTELCLLCQTQTDLKSPVFKDEIQRNLELGVGGGEAKA